MSSDIPDLSLAMQAFIENSRQFVAADDSLSAQRDNFARVCRHHRPNKPEYIEQRDIQLAGRSARVYRPSRKAPPAGWTTVLYLHGGGWTMGSHQTHDYIAYALLSRVDLAIVVLDYSLAPEAPYPAALQDALGAYEALRRGLAGSGLSIDRIVVAGDSAGANIAAGLCLRLREAGGRQPLAQVLLFPVVTDEIDAGSMARYVDGPLLSVKGLQSSIQAYLPDMQDRKKADAMPLRARCHAGLASALIAAGQCDPLHDQAVRYGEALAGSGVPVTIHEAIGMVHGALRGTDIAEVCSVYDAAAQFLRDVEVSR